MEEASEVYEKVSQSEEGSARGETARESGRLSDGGARGKRRNKEKVSSFPHEVRLWLSIVSL